MSGDDFSWTYQPESDEPIVDGEEAAHEIISKNEPLLWPSRLIASLGGKTVSATKNASVDLDQDVDLSMLSDAFDQKQFEEDLGSAIDEFNDGRSGTFEASSSYDEDAGSSPSKRPVPTRKSTAIMSSNMPRFSLPHFRIPSTSTRSATTPTNLLTARSPTTRFRPHVTPPTISWAST
ncbi:MAG: hypothetical protein ACLTXI_00880 [Collinsella sp.]